MFTFVSDIVELWDVLPLEARLSVITFILTLILLCFSSVLIPLFACSRRRMLPSRYIRLLLLVLPIAMFISWVGMAPRRFVIESSGFEYASTLPKLSKMMVAESSCTLASRSVSEQNVCFRSCASGGGCYPRLRGLCVSDFDAFVCAESWLQSSLEIHVHVDGVSKKFAVEYRNCSLSSTEALDERQAQWQQGLTLVLDSIFQDARSGHIYHEMEKLTSALYLMGALDTNVSSTDDVHGNMLNRAQVFWFANQESLSVVTRSVINAFFTAPAINTKREIVFKSQNRNQFADYFCFKDAVLIRSGHGSITPSSEATNVLREAVMRPCKLDSNARANTIAKTALLMDRDPPRCFANRLEILSSLQKHVPQVYESVASGALSMCEQLKLIIDADVIVSPHGSQHTLFIFAKKEAIIIEVQPFLYYDANNILFLYRAGLGFRIHESMGTPDFERSLIHRLFANFGWVDCMGKHACKARMRKAPVKTNVTDVLTFIRRASEFTNLTTS